ncbi:hypothetical protein DL763_004330 [Monosporascus cannonballus]|nr:hypothetical protein DL763_004330 [Monosporascus cannonballus]
MTGAETTVPQRDRPDVYLVDAGTNDRALNIDIPSAGGRTGALVDYLRGPTLDATVLLSTLLPNSDAAGEGRLTPDDIQDGTHPSDEGHATVGPDSVQRPTDADARDFLQEAV